MYLKSIEIQGFKSFANKTVFQFHSGITGIVGPNGSGKSNVADAVRWVLGEQRAKQLRGGNMQDVIFSGTQTRKPLSYAYVSITLNNSDHALPVSFEEVTITRRLYRSGESEYMINGVQCRLKDIYEMFYDTGIGKEGYSIIGQGQVDRILSGKPEERRELFDEAAGIVKYKRRKIEAQRKLDSEQAHLVRVNDILAELERQVGPLKRQSEKAKAYLKFREELKAYDVNLFLSEYQENRDSIAAQKQVLEQSSGELEEVRAENEKAREQYEAARQELEAANTRQDELIRLRSDTERNTEQKNSRIGILEEQIHSGDEARMRHEERIQKILEETGEAENRIRVMAEEERALEERARELAASGEELRKDQQELTSDIAQEESRADSFQQQMIAELSRRAELKAEEQRLETMSEQIKIRKSRLGGEILRLRGEQTGHERQLQAIDTQLEQVGRKIDTLMAESTGKDELLSACQERLMTDSRHLEELQTAYHRDASRLEALRNIAERYDGYGSSIRHVMEKKRRVRGILGVVADLIRTKKEYETAIETALGGTIQNIVTEDEETAKSMIAFLKENRFGRATFLPLTAMKHAPAWKQEDALTRNGVIGLADTLVEADPKYKDLVRYLLGRTVVVDTIDNAVRLAREFRYSLRIVTLDGELLSPGGSMTGGAFKNTSSLLSRRREIEDLTQVTRSENAKLEELKERIDAARIERNAIRDEIREIGERLQEQYLKQNTLTTQKKELSARKENAAEDENRFNDESIEIRSQIMQLTRESMALRGKLEESQDKENEIGLQLENAQERLEELRGKETRLQEKLQKVVLESASAAQKMEYLGTEKQRLTEQTERLRTEQQNILGLLEASKLGSEQKEQQIAQLRDEILALQQEEQRLEKELSEVQEKREELGKKQHAFFEKREELAERSSLLDRECYRLQNQIEKLEEHGEARITYMWEEYELTYSSALPLKRDDLGSKTSWRKNMAELRRQIRDLGNVNVGAIEEYREVSERYTFLSEQREDIRKAEEALQKIISDLESGMRRQFREQFARIAEEFDRTFRQLFGGGTGTLELLEDEDILECGIGINAQPPGKKLVNMMQMSGGEKALTAIALLFAIQNLKPSPFCLLDEIEAALDENNVTRYARYLQRLARHTQFIIITHRRGTMGAADRLYGVTMQEKGVSALVSVNLIENELDA